MVMRRFATERCEDFGTSVAARSAVATTADRTFGPRMELRTDSEAQQLGSQSPQVNIRPVRTRKEPEHRRPADAHACELGGRRGMKLVQLPRREKFFIGGPVVPLQPENLAEVDAANGIRR